MHFLPNPEFFTRPLDDARETAKRAIREAGHRVAGTLDRLERAYRERDALRRLESALARHLREGTVRTLPRLRSRGWQPEPHLHVLEEPPWRAILFASPTGRFVLGLVFSRDPHDLRARLPELIGAMAADTGEPAERAP